MGFCWASLWRQGWLRNGCSLGPAPWPRRALLGERIHFHIDRLTGMPESGVLWRKRCLITNTRNAWLFTTAKYQSGFAEGPFPAGIRVDGGGWEKEKKSRRGQRRGCVLERMPRDRQPPLRDSQRGRGESGILGSGARSSVRPRSPARRAEVAAPGTAFAAAVAAAANRLDKYQSQPRPSNPSCSKMPRFSGDARGGERKS